MGLLGGWINKYKKTVWFALGLNFLVMVGIFVIMRPFFETNDDIIISSIANGAYDVRDAHLVFINYVMGVVYKLFYSLPGRLPWHTFFQYFILWISFSAVTYVVLQRMESAAGICVMGILLVYFGYEGYARMQFTKVAGIAAGAAMFLLLYAVTKEKVSWRAVIGGWILGCVGFMYRFDEFLACAALMTGVGLYILLELFRKKEEKKFRRILTYAAVFGIQLVLVLGLRIFNKYMYTSDPVWSYYDEYNDARWELMDFGFPDYEKNKEALEALGINKDAYDLYKSLSFDDPDKFGLEVMREVLKLKKERTLNTTVVRKFLKRFPVRFFEEHAFYAFLILFLFWLMFGKRSVSSVLAVAYEVLLFYGLYFYLYYRGRYLVNRVDVGLWFAVCLVLVWMLAEGKMRISPQMCAIFCLGALIMSQREWRDNWRTNTRNYTAARLSSRAVLETVSRDKDHLYLAKVNTVSAANSYSPFNRMPYGILNNICWLGGWETNSGFSLSVLEKYGVTNPYRDMIGNESVYLVDPDIDLTMRYIHAYYDENAEAVQVDEIGGCKIYQIGGTNETSVDMD